MDPEIQFTLAWSPSELQFLDTKIVVQDGKLSIELYKKATDKNTWLWFDSCHPRRMVESLPYSQMLRAKWIVEDDNIVENTLTGMPLDFHERGYPKKLIDTQRSKVLKKSRHDLLHATRQERTMTRINFVSTDNDLSPIITGILRKHWSIGGVTPTLRISGFLLSCRIGGHETSKIS